MYAELGAGGMATVFLALDLALDRQVAIKVMSPALLTSPGAIDRFRREARTAAALSHPHIVPIHAIGEEPGLAYYIMKYIEGTSLDAVLRAEGRQDLPFAQAILGSVGGALQYAHARGVVHRDVKPANIMLDRDGWCYVTDFGIAKSDDGVGITKSGVIIGTPHYMCPEQFNGLPITGAADQYALGVVAFELLTGAPPYGGPSIGEVMRGHLMEPIPDLRAVRGDLPEAVIACVSRMLAKDPGDRFASVLDAVEAFGRASATEERETRALLASLAVTGARAQPSVSVPTSPVPSRRPTVHANLVNAATTPIDNSIPGTREVPSTGAGAVAPATIARATGRTRGARARVALALVGAAIAGVYAAGVRDVTPPLLVPPTDTARLGAGEGALAGAAPDAASIPADSGDTAATAAAAPRPKPTPASVKPAPVVARTESAASTPVVPETSAAPTRPARSVRDRLQDINARRESAGQEPIEAAMVRIGSRIPLAVLYVNDRPRDVIGMKGLQRVAVPTGRVTLSIRADNCQSWDTTFIATAGALHSIGNRGPRC